MKREGRQHGLVATCPLLLSTQQQDPIPSSRKNKFDRQPTAGNFIKVSRKPTNHSKYTSRCSRPGCTSCHICPASKAKDKTKGTRKLRSSDVVTNYKLLTWRVVDARPGYHFSGFSASGVLDQLDCYEDEEINDGEEYGSTNPMEEEIGDYNNSGKEEDKDEDEDGWFLVQGI